MRRSGLQHPGFAAIRLVLGAVGPSALERFVLIAIANHVDRAACAWKERLAAETGLGVRTVRNAVRGLEVRGLLKVTRRGRRLPNTYRLDVAALETLPRITVTGTTVQSDRHVVPLTDAERPASDDTVTGTSLQSDRHVVPPNGIKRNGVMNGSIQNGAGAPSDALAWLDLLNRETRGTFKVTDSNLRPIRARLREGHTLDQAEAVVRDRKRRWAGTERAEFLRPATVFGPKFDGYLQAAMNGNGRRDINEQWKDVKGGEVRL
jgi:uncharacterized phage protein (TIGR02220 family)